MNFYDLKINKANGDPIDFSDFHEKVVLIINTASKCGFAPQFKDLEELHQKYKKDGLVILGFPSNQFLNQEPESNDAVEEVCRLNYGVTFQLTEKIDVNGNQAHPVFRFLKENLHGTFGKKIKWNFTKFLISKDGTAIKRYAPATKASTIEKDIIKLL